MRRNNGIINTDYLENVLNDVVEELRNKNILKHSRIDNMINYELRNGVLKNTKLDDIITLKNLLHITSEDLLENKLYNKLINDNAKNIVYNDKRKILYKNIEVVVNTTAELNIKTNYLMVEYKDPIYGDLTEIRLKPRIDHPVKYITYEISLYIYKDAKNKVVKKKTIEIPELVNVKTEKEALELMKNVYELNINTILMDETLMIEEKSKLIK